jgi:multiple sugar transport system substrate-binding protein
MNRGMSRRRVLKGTTAGAGGLLLAACGAVQQSQTAQPAAKAAAISGPIELMWSTEQVTQDFVEKDWFVKFKQENPQVEMSLNVVPGSWPELFQKIQVTNAAGTPPALTRGKDYFTGDMAQMGYVEPLDKYIKGQKEITAEQYLPSIWGNATYKGVQIGIPLYSFVRPLYYNTQLFREAGLMQGDKPIVAETWQDYARMARQLTQPSKGIWGTQLYSYAGEDATSAWTNYLIQAGGEYINADRTKYLFNSPAGIEALQFIVDLIQKDHALRGPKDDNPAGVPKIAMYNAVGDGKYNKYPKDLPDFQYNITMVPRNKNRGVVARGQNLYMMKNGKNHEGAWAFMRFAARDDNSHNFTQTISLGPAKLVNFEKEPYKSSWEWKVNLDQFRIKENVYQPIFGGYTEGSVAISEELIASYMGQKAPKDALADAERRATLLLKP